MSLGKADPIRFSVSPDWSMDWNQFYGVDPTQLPLPTGDDTTYTAWDCYFGEDLLQFTNQARLLIIDVGWYPARSPAGCFIGHLIRYSESIDGYGWDSPLETIETRDPQEIVAFVNRICR